MSIIGKSLMLFIGACTLSLSISPVHASAVDSLFGNSGDLFGSSGDIDSLFGGSRSSNQWVNAEKIGAESRGYFYAICHYKTSSYSNFPNHRFSITIEGSQYSCPYSVKFNPVTNAWKK